MKSTLALLIIFSTTLYAQDYKLRDLTVSIAHDKVVKAQFQENDRQDYQGWQIAIKDELAITISSATNTDGHQTNSLSMAYRIVPER